MNNLTHSEEVYGKNTDSVGNTYWYGVYSGYHTVKTLDDSKLEIFVDPAGNEILTIPKVNQIKKLIIEFKDEK